MKLVVEVDGISHTGARRRADARRDAALRSAGYRVLRLEDISTEIQPGFPITAASKIIDYDWVTINDVSHLLPSRAVVELTAHDRGQTEQTRNEILFRGYRKFGAEVKIIDIDEKDFPPDKPEEEPKKPDTPPALKPAVKKP